MSDKNNIVVWHCPVINRTLVSPTNFIVSKNPLIRCRVFERSGRSPNFIIDKLIEVSASLCVQYMKHDFPISAWWDKRIILAQNAEDASNVKILQRQWMPEEVAHPEHFHGGVFQWHMVIICSWCALFLTSQLDVIFMFSSEVCWHNRHILLHALLYFCKKSSPIHSPYIKVFVKYQAQWGGWTPTPPTLAYALGQKGNYLCLGKLLPSKYLSQPIASSKWWCTMWCAKHIYLMRLKEKT